LDDRQAEFEKLGAFYLGRMRDSSTGQPTNELLLYDSRDLTTHGVIIGMTGSGKTGLGLGIIEEAAMDRIPVIAIDPKGDLANLLLTFPDLSPSDFRPWVNEEVLVRRARIRTRLRLRRPSSGDRGWRAGARTASASAPAVARRLSPSTRPAARRAGRSRCSARSRSRGRRCSATPDALRERIQSTVTSLLALLGIQADPIRSREHILLSNILQHAWEHGRIPRAGSPHRGDPAAAVRPGRCHGARELLLRPGTGSTGAPAERAPRLARLPGLDGGRAAARAVLPVHAGRETRVSIFSIAHLGDDERMFFVAMLLNEIVSWMRGQSRHVEPACARLHGRDLRVLPAHGQPAVQGPMLTLLKQARAYGVGMLLATQNPVDLDYKGLGNTGSWFIGRLQTERDKARIMDALQGAMAGSTPLPRAELDRLISGLGKRVFLLHNVHDRAPTLFETRWVMSYMAGPMTLQQIRGVLSGRGLSQRARGGR
jgi:hypothetical protein